jgi:TPR repeat protein
VEEGKGNMLSMFASSSQARPYYQRSADLGYPDAIYRMGLYYQADGKYDEAWRTFCRGAELEHAGCLRMIGSFYQRGVGRIRKNYVNAVSYYKQAASREDAESYYRLGYLLEEMALDEPMKVQKVKFLKEALDWLTQADNVKFTPRSGEVPLSDLMTRIQDKLNSL